MGAKGIVHDQEPLEVSGSESINDRHEFGKVAIDVTGMGRHVEELSRLCVKDVCL